MKILLRLRTHNIEILNTPLIRLYISVSKWQILATQLAGQTLAAK